MLRRLTVHGISDSLEDSAEPSQSDSPPDRSDDSLSLGPDIGKGWVDIFKAQIQGTGARRALNPAYSPQDFGSFARGGKPRFETGP
jgi:hypothetical protein